LSLELYDPNKIVWTNMYFALTTLTTVGFGDYYPISNTERLVGSFMLLFGVMTSNFIMGELMNMITRIKLMTKIDY
jgi:voltage-gated potassium channel